MVTDAVRVRRSSADDQDGIKTLADANEASLGFILRPVLAGGIYRGWTAVAEQAGRVIGFVHYRHRQDFQTTLYEICVDEAFRRNGGGPSLVQALAPESKTLHKACIRIEAPGDLPADKFYQRLGSALAGTERANRAR